MTFQIRRNGNGGVALYEGANAAEALAEYAANKARAKAKLDIETLEDGTAVLTLDGERYEAVVVEDGG